MAVEVAERAAEGYPAGVAERGVGDLAADFRWAAGGLAEVGEGLVAVALRDSAAEQRGRLAAGRPD